MACLIGRDSGAMLWWRGRTDSWTGPRRGASDVRAPSTLQTPRVQGVLAFDRRVWASTSAG